MVAMDRNMPSDSSAERFHPPKVVFTAAKRLPLTTRWGPGLAAGGPASEPYRGDHENTPTSGNKDGLQYQAHRRKHRPD